MFEFTDSSAEQYTIAVHLVVIAHNIRSTHNIGSIFRTCDGFGVEHLYLTGYSPFPTLKNDSRPPFIGEKLTKQIHKAALGAENNVSFSHSEQPEPVMSKLKQSGFVLVGLEQIPQSVPLSAFEAASKKIALVLGEEVNGISEEIQKLCDYFVEIPMRGKKESFNVSVATGIALFGLTEMKQFE
ncbi:MAG TPA: TrmH family RNA methyltransferase [Candidatus Saccharimonadales bacterium]